MSDLIQRMFGGGPKKDKVTTSDAIQKLREMEDTLGKRQHFLEKKIQDELTLAKQHGTKNKRQALAALARKKRYEQQLTQIDGTLTTIEYQREALESASTNAAVLQTMQFGAQALKQAHNNLDVDKVHDVMDEISEQQQIANEISQAISQPTGLGAMVDEDELMKELEDLEQESVNEQLMNAESVVPLPAVPDSLPEQPAKQATAQKKKVAVAADADLDELEKWAAN